MFSVCVLQRRKDHNERTLWEIQTMLFSTKNAQEMFSNYIRMQLGLYTYVAGID
jgi:hypothetical protein